MARYLVKATALVTVRTSYDTENGATKEPPTAKTIEEGLRDTMDEDSWYPSRIRVLKFEREKVND